MKWSFSKQVLSVLPSISSYLKFVFSLPLSKSVLIPGFTINRICAGSLFSLAKVAPKLPLTTRKWITTAVGLGVIPFIVHPIDSGVHWGMDNTTRKWIGGADIKLD